MIGELMTTRGFVSATARKSSSHYIDKWFESIVKTDSFYEKHANGKPRRYFYNVDLNGRLFLEETVPKNIASSIKDEKFLNFFFSRIRWVQPEKTNILLEGGLCDQYPFVSLCGGEVNYIRPACSPIVFHSALFNDNNGDVLVYGGSLTQPFDESRLAVSKNSGRLYHELAHPLKGNKRGTDFGLLRSSIVIALADRLLPGTSDGSAWSFLRDDGSAVQIDWLPEWAEPGDWAMPYGSTQLAED